MHSALVLTPEAPRRRLFSTLITLGALSTFLVVFFCLTHLRHSFPIHVVFFPRRAPVQHIIKPIEIPFDSHLVGLDAPVEWNKAPLQQTARWTNAVKWPALQGVTPSWRNAHPTPIHVFPRTIELNSRSPDPADLIFGMSTTAKRAKSLSVLWPAWLGRNEASGATPLCVIVLPAEDYIGGHNSPAMLLSEKLAQELHLENCQFQSSWLGRTARYELRYFAMLRDMAHAARETNRRPSWYIVSDDDTLWTDQRMLRRELSQYDPEDEWLLSGSSENLRQLQDFGRMAFGGAGIIISRGLCEKMLNIISSCTAEFSDVYGGDGMYSLCAARAMGHGKTKETVVTQVSSMHQFDLRGDGSGFFQSGLPFLTLHHCWHGRWTKPFGPDHQTSLDGPDNRLNQLILLGQAAGVLGGDNFLRRSVHDDGRELLTLGYSFTRFDKPLKISDLHLIEKTWSSAIAVRFPTRPHIVETNERGTGGKRTYYLSQIRYSEIGTNKIIFVHQDRWGDQIEIVWKGDDSKILTPSSEGGSFWRDRRRHVTAPQSPVNTKLSGFCSLAKLKSDKNQCTE